MLMYDLCLFGESAKLFSFLIQSNYSLSKSNRFRCSVKVSIFLSSIILPFLYAYKYLVTNYNLYKLNCFDSF